MPDQPGFTVIAGPQGSGRSAMLRERALRSAATYLDGKAIHTLPGVEVARRLGLLPPAQSAPEGITVADLVGLGPGADDEAVAGAMRATGTLELADRYVDELCGGWRQRAWIAMALAQRTGVLLLDEPTTLLDVAEQVELLDLLADLNRGEGTVIVTVLHDVNLACRYADHLLVLKDGDLVAGGSPADVVSEELVREVFGLPCRVVPDPVSASPLIVPIGRHHAGRTVSTEDELRDVVEEPAQVILDKPVAGIDDESRRFLEASPFFLLATSADDGSVDVSPRGDPAGTVLVLGDGRTLAFADRNGNRRVDSMRNILRNARVGMLFVVPGVDHTLRVNGTATIVREGPLLERLAVNGTAPDLAITVEVDELFVHCGRAFTRSSLWDKETWPEPNKIPTAGTLFKSQAALRASLGEGRTRVPPPL
ncbi:MSMEG_1061 family FMN-dependent PPOX-type flavoprotein [Prauserella endophytica]|uniref:MSMEG_1061 family FMN-dependent PPOX-type flavoprotein n=1 Tax=Prauserella endophytica TaxID=1592324 RepID=UPI001E603564|nr:MSMEG_1061 family FMN-dependent PPOX-type flavoprotein [Prauserella endophytica]